MESARIEQACPGRRPVRGREALLASRLADHTTGLIRNCWYVAAWSHELGRDLLRRTILGRNLVLFRTEAGEPAALHDRCPHRSFPLSKGKLEGNTIRCGYHGMVFDTGGNCIEIPSQEVASRGIKVPSFPLVERAPLVWIWMGDPGEAHESSIPDTPWLDSPDWSFASDYIRLDSNYVGLHENLLDLTHFTYLHPTTLGTPEYARTPFSVEVGGGRSAVRRFVPSCDPPPIYAGPTGLTGKKMSRDTYSEFVSPSTHIASAILTNLEPDPDSRDTFTVRISHFVTPETQGSTHYFFTFARDFAVDDADVTAFMAKSALEAFYEDVAALESITEVERRERGSGFVEINIKSDQAGIAARQILKRLADAESAVTAARA